MLLLTLSMSRIYVEEMEDDEVRDATPNVNEDLSWYSLLDKNAHYSALTH